MGAAATASLIPATEDPWLQRFHAGSKMVIEECYREHYGVVERSVRAVVRGTDKETVIHDLFLRLLEERSLRESFRGGSFPAWLTTVARNLAIDTVRKKREEPAGVSPDAFPAGPPTPAFDESADARMLIDRFRRERLPAKWAPVFEARFLKQLDQRSAAQSLSMHRTTLVYQEMRIRSLLRDFLLGDDA
jgi:RNA polymerase sigma-70 factor (ECF subfamily)